jgi:hypothetical protein
VFIRIPCQSIRLSTIQDFHVSLLHHKPLLRASYLPRQSGFPRCTLWLTPANGTYDNILRHVLENVRPPFQRDWRPRICDCRQSHYNFTFDFRRDTMFPASTLGLSRTLLKPTAFHRPASTRPLPVVPPASAANATTRKKTTRCNRFTSWTSMVLVVGGSVSSFVMRRRPVAREKVVLEEFESKLL